MMVPLCPDAVLFTRSGCYWDAKDIHKHSLPFSVIVLSVRTQNRA